MVKALEGIRVLDLTQLLPGPYCTGILADFGAEVIKVEPKGGDYGRLFPGMFNQVNRSKKSITLNLKEEEAQRIFHRLLLSADVVVEGFRPGTTARLGVDYETCEKINPRIIYCSISGYGQDGPYRDRPGHDLNYMSIGGALSLLKGRDGHPINPGLEMADVTAGLEAVIAILTALLARDKTGRGQFLDISMLDCVVSILPMQASAYFSMGTVPPTNMTDFCSHYRVFDTADDDYLVMGIVHEDWFWSNLADALEGFEDVRDLKHLKRLERRDELIERLSAAFRSKTLSEWLELLDGRDIPYSTINDIAQVFEDPQVMHRRMKVAIPGPQGEIECVGTPYKMSGTPVTFDAPAPELGEHTDSILAESGLSPADISELREAGTI
jgi:crotonobetainyl-CoA:carnitine CoA-transferase CaiB-like acyl-CoA transferase